MAGSDPIVREENAADHTAVEALIAAAFAPMPFASGTEAALVRALREAGAATLALVAEREGRVVGQALFSPAAVGGRPSGWLTLGPVSVAPGLQRQGVGSALIQEGLRRLRATEGCIVEGDPGYYRRFGFAPAPSLAPLGAPEEFFLVLPLGAPLPLARFGYHSAFGAP